MAIIHGIADSESNLLDKLPNEVENIEDIDRVKKEFEEKLAKEKSGFFGGIKKWNYYALSLQSVSGQLKYIGRNGQNILE